MSYLLGLRSRTSTPCRSTTLPKTVTTRACESTSGLEHRHEMARIAKTEQPLHTPLHSHPHPRPRSPVTIRAPMTSALALGATLLPLIRRISPPREARRRRGGGNAMRKAAAEQDQSADSRPARAWASGELRSSWQSSRASRHPWLRRTLTPRRKASRRRSPRCLSREKDRSTRTARGSHQRHRSSKAPRRRWPQHQMSN